MKDRTAAGSGRPDSVLHPQSNGHNGNPSLLVRHRGNSVFSLQRPRPASDDDGHDPHRDEDEGCVLFSDLQESAQTE